MRDKKINKLIYLFCGYMLTTLALYFMSPVNYATKQPPFLIILVLFYIIAFYFGAMCGNRIAYKHGYKSIQGALKENYKTLYCAIIILLFFTILCVGNNIARIGGSGIIDALFRALSDSNAAYFSKMEEQSGSLINVMTILGAPIYVYAYVGGLMKFRNLRRSFKVLYILCIVLEIIRWLLVGTNKGLFDLVILFLFYALVARMFVNDKNPKKTSKENRKRILLVALALGGALVFFGITISSRLSVNFGNLYGQGVISVNENHMIFKLLPPALAIVLLRFVGYLTHGYYGMSLGLSIPWQPTFFMGSNLFITSYAEKLLGLDISSALYQTRIEEIYGWSATAKWHTMYLWLANDFSFVGVIPVMFILGYLLSRGLVDGIYRNNIKAMCIAYLITMSIIYSSANNQVFGVGNTFFAFVVLIIGWKFPFKIKWR